MGNTDSVPVVSQAKSFAQFASGDKEGARKTQENFVRGCPVVSQAVSLGQLVTGDVEGAIETQEYCAKNIVKTLDYVPVVGHAKGFIHYAAGDKEAGNKATAAATRSSGILMGGIAGAVVAGPAGAVAGGIAGGAGVDKIMTELDAAGDGEQNNVALP